MQFRVLCSVTRTRFLVYVARLGSRNSSIVLSQSALFVVYPFLEIIVASFPSRGDTAAVSVGVGWSWGWWGGVGAVGTLQPQDVAITMSIHLFPPSHPFFLVRILFLYLFHLGCSLPCPPSCNSRPNEQKQGRRGCRRVGLPKLERSLRCWFLTGRVGLVFLFPLPFYFVFPYSLTCVRTWGVKTGGRSQHYWWYIKKGKSPVSPSLFWCFQTVVAILPGPPAPSSLMRHSFNIDLSSPPPPIRKQSYISV